MKMKYKLLVVLAVLIFCVSAVSADPTCSFINITTGPTGANGTSCTISVNSTTTGAAGTDANVTNVGNDTVASFDFVIPQGTIGEASNTSDFYLINTTRALTGSTIKRDVNSSQITLYGGDSTGGSGAVFSVMGRDYGEHGSIFAYVADAYGNGYSSLFHAHGVTDNPELSLDNNPIVDLMTGTTGDSAVNKSYVDSIATGYNATYDDLVRDDYVYTGNLSYVLTDNLTYALDSEVSAVNTSMKNYVDLTNTTMKAYVDAGLPYVAEGNTSLVLTSNTSYLLGSNTSIATTTFVGEVNTSMKDYVDLEIAGVGEPDLTEFLFINGTREMTGEFQMGGFNISNVLDPVGDQDAATRNFVMTVNSSMKDYVDGLPSDTYNATYDDLVREDYVYTGNTSYLLGSNASIATVTYVGEVNTSMKNYVDAGLPYVAEDNETLVLTTNTSYLLGSNVSIATTDFVGEVNTTMKNYVDGEISGVGTPDFTPFLFINGSRAMTGDLDAGSKEIINLITGSAGTSGVNKTYVDLTNSTMKTYVDTGLPYVAEGNSSLVLTSNTTYLLGTNTSIATTTYVGEVNTSMKNYVDAGLPYVAEGNETLVLTSNDTYVLTNNASYILGTNTSHVLTDNTSYVLTDNTTYVLTDNATYVKNPVYGYVTLMAGSGMIPTTNPAEMNQWETTTNKNNYIYANFTDGGTENLQWIVDMPGDWNSADADDGKLAFSSLWTSVDGTGGTVNFVIAARLFPDDAALDTALATVGTCNDTWIVASDMHVSDYSTPAVVTGSPGQTMIVKATRDSDTDTFDGTAQLIGVKVKYIYTLAG